jgi:transmembrane sensor
MNEQRFWDLVTKLLSNEITEQEKNELSIILQIDQYKKQFEKIVGNWNNQKRENLKFDSANGLETLTQRLKERDRSFFWGDKVKTNKNLFINPYLLKVAASIIFFMLIATAVLYYGNLFKKPKAEIAWNEKETVLGQKYILELGDHSIVTLNAQSKIKYPTVFGKDSRDIYLEGEAFFNVSHDSTKPFIVHAGNISTTVLGTRFNVNAFSAEKNIEVSLVEGSVKISKVKNESLEDIVILSPKQQIVFNKQAEVGKVEQFDIQETTGWKDNILIFKKELFSSVLVKLERQYGVKFELMDKSLGSKKITANFQNASLWTVTEALKKLTGLQYKTIKENNETKKIIFYKK